MALKTAFLKKLFASFYHLTYNWDSEKQAGTKAGAPGSS